MGTEDVGIGIDHLWFEPNAKGHTKAFDVIDQRSQPIGVLAWIDLPIGQRLRVVIAVAKPAIIQHEPFGPQGDSAFRDLFQLIKVMIEIDGFPTVVMHRTRRIRAGKGHDPIAQMALERDGTAVQAIIRKHGIQLASGKSFLRLPFHPSGVTKLDLAAPIG